MKPALAQQIKLPSKPPLSQAGVPRPLARQIASRTTDLIAVGVVLIGGLTMGRSVVEWWRAESPSVSPSAALPSPGWGTDQAPLQLEFGDARMALTRQVVAGDETAAHERLIALCRQITEAAQVTPTEPTSAAEDELLAKTEGIEPAAGGPGDWGVYRLGEDFSLVAGVRWIGSNGNSHASREPRSKSPFPPGGGRVGDGGDTPRLTPPFTLTLDPSPLKGEGRASAHRLVCWGLAFPQGDARWMLSVFTAAGVATANSGDWPDVQFPPGARRSLALRDERGSGLIGFSGTGDPAAWCEFFTENLQQSGWHSHTGWQPTHKRSSARFLSQTRPDAGTIEIQFSSDRNNEMTGLIQFLPGQNDLSAPISVN